MLDDKRILFILCLVFALLIGLLIGSRATAMQFSINVQAPCTMVWGGGTCTAGRIDRSPQSGGSQTQPPPTQPPQTRPTTKKPSHVAEGIASVVS
jgi:hypothetical protein